MNRKNNFFDECCWFKFNNLGLALSMTLTFYTSLSKGLKLSQKVLRANCYVCRSYREKTGMETFCPSPSRTGLKYIPVYTIENNKESLYQAFSLNRKKIFKFHLRQLKFVVYKWKTKSLKKKKKITSLRWILWKIDGCLRWMQWNTKPTLVR